ncbi:MAG TPA: hypothetical protein VGI85_09055 [Chthoniobacterales bacterium]|jgi:hypothetical protein
MRLFRAALAAFILLPLLSCAADEIPPPFGFRWNDKAARVERVLKGAKAKIVSRETSGAKQVWTVTGLIHPGLKRTLFTFKAGLLTQVELQYEYPDWTLEHYNERMGEIRRYFDSKYGIGRLISRSRDNETKVIQTLVGYQWVVGKSALELFYFSAQEGKNIYRNITVTYKAI